MLHRKSLLLVAAGLLLAGAAIGRGGEIGWIEDFALATDRSRALEQLIPGTGDYYYYHCLDFQNTEQWDKVEPLLKAWVEKHGWTPRAIEIRNRQALLTYKQHPEQTLDLIRRRLNLQFDHQREQLNEKPNLPSRLDAALLAKERLDKLALQQFPNTLQGFEDAALERLIPAELSPDQRWQLISRLQRPDRAGLVKLIVADMARKDSGGFGQFAIHGRLLLAQLDECLRLKPDLRNQQKFVNAYLARLHPSDDLNWRQDRSATLAYLQRLWGFVQTLEPAHNSLKAHVLYHRLVLDCSLGKYDVERLLEYLRLPRQVSYIELKYLERTVRQQGAANLREDYSSVTLLPPVGDDESLVRSYLAHFLLGAEDYTPFAPYVNDRYLKELFAETKIVHGLGNAERWHALLPPAAYQRLKERIDLDFAASNKNQFAVDEAVSLDLDVKNVETLIVKVFEINTQNFYQQNLREVGAGINLDGLVASEEKTWTYKEPPLRRARRHFDFPTLNKRGVYVIDFIGNGRASRALVRKGKLKHLVRSSVAGQVFTILDEQNQPLPKASLWLAGVNYQPDKDGAITTPYSSQPGRQPIVLSFDGFASLDHFDQEGEQYDFTAAMVVDREQLIARRAAKLILRPRLSVNGAAVSNKALERVRLSITSTDLDNVATTKEVADLELLDDRETVYEFQVPPRLASIGFQLSAQTQNYSQNKKVDLVAIQNFALNEIDRSDKTADLHLARSGADYVIEALGKTGEPKANRAVQIALKLRDYTQPAQFSLQTDDRGRVVLGPLAGVEIVSATGPQGVSHAWPLRHDEHTYPQTINALVGEPIEIPYMGGEAKPDRGELSLLELRGDEFVADRFEHISLDGDLLKLAKLPPGDYSLLLKREQRAIRLRVTAGATSHGYALGDYRQLELRNTHPLQIETPVVTDQTIRLQLRNASPYARVHLFASRFEPAHHQFGNFARILPQEPYAQQTPLPESQYIAGRDIGDEYRYILDRRYAHKYPGNMLERPSLLLNPWAIRGTETGEQSAAEGAEFGAAGAVGQGKGQRAAPWGSDADDRVATAPGFANLDFLAHSGLVMANLAADEQGVIEIKRAELGPHQELLIVGVDPQNTVSRIVTLPAIKDEFLDLRLAKGLDPHQHFTQQKRITLVPAQGKLVVADITSARLETYDTLGRLLALCAALHPDAALSEFGFLRDWPSLKLEEKRTLYLKHACHELHFFLYRHDPEFFKTAIRPYLANKKEKQLVDRWLLDEKLDDFAQPWNFEQLNTFERILLGRRVAEERSRVSRLIDDQVALLPPDADRFNHLFETALKGSALDTQRGVASFDALGEVRVPIDLFATELEKTALSAAEPEAMDGAAAVASMAGKPASSRAGSDRRRMVELKSMDEKAKADAGELRAGGRVNLNRSGEMALFDELQRDKDAALKQQQYYRKLDKTLEWVESNYYKLPIEQQTAAIIAASAFWRDVAQHDPAQPFLSTNIAEATHSFPEMLLALALVDLPFKAAEHKTEFQGAQMTFTAGSPAIVYHEEIQPAAKVAEHPPILISENFFRQGDRQRQVNGEQVDNFVSEEFLADTVYGCQIVVTNPTSSKKKVDVLLQIPRGALPVASGRYTHSPHLDLEPYHTQTLEYFFYFPSPGKYAHYPVHVTRGDEALAFAAPFEFNVVAELTKIDKQSWDYVSQQGSAEDVLDFLKRENLLAVNLDRIAWRMRDGQFFDQAIPILAARHVYSHTLWSYAVLHNRARAARQFLQFAGDFVSQCGEWLESPLLTIEPITRKLYQQMDYKPLVNARTGQLGRERQILNDRFLAQYERLLKILSYRRAPSDTELMTVTYYLLLQDRVEPALEFFGRVNAEGLDTRLQYDYFAAYLAFYKSQPREARAIAARYADYPVDRWRLAFADVVNQADDISRPVAAVADPQSREQQQTSAAATTPSFDFAVEAKKVKLNFQNLTDVRVNYYVMDIELLFSRNPFVQGESKQFSYIVPNQSQVVRLPAKGTSFEFALPAALTSSNVLVEIVGGGQTQSRAYYSSALQAQLIENYGQVQVTHDKPATPLAKVYVKVFARLRDGHVRFYKDGYTDLRGRFDYASLSTNELDDVDRFSLLILSEEQGALVREAQPPRR